MTGDGAIITERTIRGMLVSQGITAHGFVDSAEGLRCPKDRAAVREVTDWLRANLRAWDLACAVCGRPKRWRLGRFACDRCEKSR